MPFYLLSFAPILQRYMKILIGRTDVAEFPELEIDEISVKVDTGAYTSAIHATEIEEIPGGGERCVQFKILDESHPAFNDKVFRFKKYTKKKIKNSFGQAEERFIIETTIRLFGIDYPIALSLSERTDLKYPVLLGRKFLRNRFIVDPSLRNSSRKRKK